MTKIDRRVRFYVFASYRDGAGLHPKGEPVAVFLSMPRAQAYRERRAQNGIVRVGSYRNEVRTCL